MEEHENRAVPGAENARSREKERGKAPATRPFTSSFALRLSLFINVIGAVLALGIGARKWLRSGSGAPGGAYSEERRSILAALPPRPGAIVFLGDSLTDRGEWAELLGEPSIQNRGISGDTTNSILLRAADIAAQKPARVFLLAGVNDLGAGEPVPAIAARYGQILDVFRNLSPQASLYCESVLPVRPPEAPLTLQNARIRELNEALSRTAAQRSCAFVDLSSTLADKSGALDARFTLDGVHLTGEGYSVWARVLAPLVNAPR